MTINELASYAAGFFETQTRPPVRPGEEGESFITLKRRHPTWLKAMMRKVHEDGNFFPDDYKYEFASQALDHLAEGMDPDEPQLEADPYRHDLLKWFASHLERAGIVDEAVENWGHSDQGVIGDIMTGQVWEKEQAFRAVVDALRERLEEIEQGIEEEFEDMGPKRDPRDWRPRKR